jgi:hypothetical protein
MIIPGISLTTHFSHVILNDKLCGAMAAILLLIAEN